MNRCLVLRHARNWRLPATSLFVVLLAAGCGREEADADLPPEDTMYLPGPDDVDDDSTGSALTQSAALCVEAPVLARLRQWVDAHNDQLSDKLALMRGLRRVARKAAKRDGSFEWTRGNPEGRSITLAAQVQDDDSITYTATFTGPVVGTHRFLEGTTAADRASGTWTVYKLDGDRVIVVTWEKSGDDLTVHREVLNTDRQITYSRVGSTVTVTFTGSNHSGSATWDRDTRAGGLTVDGEVRACWERVDGAFCGTTCP